MKKIIFIAGTKGGVGKSTFAVYVADAAEDMGLSVTMFDCDNENATLKRFKPQATAIDTDNNFALDEIVNTVCNDDKDGVFIVDMKAGTTKNSHEWFAEVPVDDLQELGIEIYLAGCITSDPDSVTTFTRWMDVFKDKVGYLVVKSHKDGDNFSFFEKNMQPVLEDLGVSVIDFPKLPLEYNEILNNTDTTINTVISGKSKIKHKRFTSIMDLARLRRYYKMYTDPIKEFLAR